MIRVTGDWDLAEDCLSDAVERALVTWPAGGVPDVPAAWLTTTAARRALDVLRRRTNEQGKLEEVRAMAHGPPPDPGGLLYRDDQLRLIYTCCHPALPLAGRVGLTLTTVGGLTVAQAARAFLVSEATMSQRLLRAKNKIRNAGITFRVPAAHRVAERTSAVLAVVYLIFNEGYTSPGRPDAEDPAAEAVRLAALLRRLRPDDAEVLGLQALLLLQHARRAARVDAAGDLVPMPEQDRGRWDHGMIARGLSRLTGPVDGPGPYRLQAEIAAVHASAPDAGSTDWARIVTLYDALLHQTHSPVVQFQRAVAVGYRDGPDAGLDALEALPALSRYPLLAAARADLHRRAGRLPEAARQYERALAAGPTDPQGRYLRRRLAEVQPPGRGDGGR